MTLSYPTSSLVTIRCVPFDTTAVIMDGGRSAAALLPIPVLPSLATGR